MFYCYILYSSSLDRYYIGSTQNVEERLKLHLNNHSGYTSKAKDWNVVYTETYPSRSEALKRENAIKRKKSRKYIEYLISAK